MLLLECSVEHSGVFAGKHRFDLRPSLGEDGSQRPLIVMIGQNGSGKTALFQALLSALYGAGSLQGSLSTHSLLSRMHRPCSGPAAEQSAVSLSFQYVHSGHLVEIQVERRWRTRHGTVEEDLSLLHDGKPLEIDPAGYPVWLYEFLSPGHGHLCGEQFDALIAPRHQSKTLEGILSRLLGLDLTQRLDGDVGQLLTRQGSSEKTSSLYKRVLELRGEADSLQWQLSQLEQDLEHLQAALADHELP
ncbi:AAA family ATPase [Thermogemmatispora tikiterensis]|nr:AAA family ATPase [Thermogemmatispora tikiterensis]